VFVLVGFLPLKLLTLDFVIAVITDFSLPYEQREWCSGGDGYV